MKKALCILLCAAILTCVLALPMSAKEFNDVPNGKWYSKAIDDISDRDVMTGVDTDSFAPNEYLTRETAALVFAKLMCADGTPPEYTEYSFSDIDPNAWYANAVEYCYRNGYTAGMGDGKFGVGSYITRQDLATMLAKISLWGTYSVSEEGDRIKFRINGGVEDWLCDKALHYNGFTDKSDISEYAKLPVILATGLYQIDYPTSQPSRAYMCGYPDNTFRPNGYITRAEFAVTMDAYMKFVMRLVK